MIFPLYIALSSAMFRCGMAIDSARLMVHRSTLRLSIENPIPIAPTLMSRVTGRLGVTRLLMAVQARVMQLL